MKSKAFFAKLLLIVLICSLISVSVGVPLFSNHFSNKQYVAKIGQEKLSIEDFTTAYHDELRYIQQLLNRPLTPEQIVQFNVKFSVLNRLIENKVLTKFANSLNLKVGEESVINFIKSIKYFQDENGNFDKKKFNAGLSNAGLTERLYISKLESAFPISIMMNCLFGGPQNNYLQYYPDLTKKILQNLHQSRTVDIIEISPVINDISIPNMEELKSLYEEKKKNNSLIFPESRDIEYVTINYENFTTKATISQEELDSEIKAEGLDNQIDILNLVFNTKSDAENALTELNNGKTFDNIVTDLAHTTLDNITLKNITKNTLPDDIRNQVFSLKEGEISPILHSMFGWHIIKVTSVHKISEHDLQELNKKISQSIKKKKATDLLLAEIEIINDKINHGTSIKEIAELYNLPIKTITTDISGYNLSGKKVSISEANPNSIILTGFSSQLNQTSNFIDNEDYFFSVRVIKIDQAREKTFDESKQELVDEWQNNFKSKKLSKLTQEILIKLKSGIDIQNIDGVLLKPNQVVYRNSVASIDNPGQNYPSNLVNEIFNLKKGEISKNYYDEQNPSEQKMLIAVVKDIKNPEQVSTVDLKATQEKLSNNNTESLKNQLITYLTNKYSVKINRKLIENIE
ncbi:peptidyl-prolyl cis-trans isomerase D [Ehrlichia ruminantium]|uniref:Parvulin-like PPIase n=2 Tax=Ehrlichia ruminantium TaxID=779 RepID=A0A170RTJ1_EHRRU|nr:peptidylprolyl isomerase [Ehrlichia ruminantium]GAT77192.1 peptidyl-prolyl cis-trans isomerase D [Ehrlichia ruminantium]